MVRSRLTKAETTRSVSVYQLCPTHLEEKRSLLPLEDQSPPVLSAIFLVSPVAALWAYLCPVDLP